MVTAMVAAVPLLLLLLLVVVANASTVAEQQAAESEAQQLPAPAISSERPGAMNVWMKFLFPAYHDPASPSVPSSAASAEEAAKLVKAGKGFVLALRMDYSEAGDMSKAPFAHWMKVCTDYVQVSVFLFAGWNKKMNPARFFWRFSIIH
jgi:hypothetical protein